MYYYFVETLFWLTAFITWAAFLGLIFSSGVKEAKSNNVFFLAAAWFVLLVMKLWPFLSQLPGN